MAAQDAGLYGSHLEEAPPDVVAPRRGSRSGPEGGVKTKVKQVPAETNPATTARASTAGTPKKTRAGKAQRLDGYR